LCRGGKASKRGEESRFWIAHKKRKWGTQDPPVTQKKRMLGEAGATTQTAAAQTRSQRGQIRSAIYSAGKWTILKGKVRRKEGGGEEEKNRGTGLKGGADGKTRYIHRGHRFLGDTKEIVGK